MVWVGKSWSLKPREKSRYVVKKRGLRMYSMYWLPEKVKNARPEATVDSMYALGSQSAFPLRDPRLSTKPF